MVNRVPNPHDLEAIETASLDELRSLQLKRLQWSVGHAYKNVAPYRAKCDAVGIVPADLKSLDDLAKFPFTVKDDLRQSYPFGMFAVPQRDIVRIHASSGTTGKPTVVAYTRNDIETWATVVARSIRASGGEADDMIHIAYGYGLFTGGLGAHYGAEKLGATVVPMSGGQTPKQVQLILDFKPDIIMVTPSYMLNIADEFERQGLDPAESSLQVGIFGAEPWGGAMRKEIEQRCGLDAVDIYGLSEVIGPGVANECIESKDGPTIWEDHFYPEIIDPETGDCLADGEPGELVFTSLTKEALPIIRYRTRDLTRLLPGTSRTMRRMDKITGRSDDMLIIRGVNVFPTQIEEQVLAVAGLAPHYQIRVGRDGQLDVITVQVEKTLEAATATDNRSTALAGKLRKSIKDFVGVSAVIEVCEPGGVTRSEGKAVRVIDERH
ncbi:MAG: phenylacetate--CoA ligase [Gammaproteobacteria bacterium]|nr:phenylacetate--CoA ligase [Gammaproteobacteria bacterium]